MPVSACFLQYSQKGVSVENQNITKPLFVFAMMKTRHKCEALYSKFSFLPVMRVNQMVDYLINTNIFATDNVSLKWTLNSASWAGFHMHMNFGHRPSEFTTKFCIWTFYVKVFYMLKTTYHN